MVNWKLKFTKPKRPLLTALVAGLGALGIAWGYLAAREAYFNHFSEPVTVFVAKQDIVEGTLIDESYLALQSFPRRFLQPGSMNDPEALVGTVSRVPILMGEQILSSKLMGLGAKSGLAYRIPEGHRALSIPVDEASGLSGLIRPGNRVDLVATFETEQLGETEAMTLTLAQNVLVLAVNREINDGPKLYRPDLEEKGLFGKKEGGSSAQFGKETLTFALKPEGVQKIKFAAEQGVLSAVLRPAWEEADRVLEPVTAFQVTGIKGNVSKAFREYRGR